MAEVMKELTPLEKSLANEQEHTLELFEQVPQRVDWMRSQIMKPGALLESDFMSGLKAFRGRSRWATTPRRGGFGATHLDRLRGREVVYRCLNRSPKALDELDARILQCEQKHRAFQALCEAR